MLAIDEKATIKNARNFFKNDLEKYRALSLSRYAIPSRMPAGVSVSGGMIDTMERKQVKGLDAVAVVDAVRDALEKMQPDNRKLLELKYLQKVKVIDIAYRTGYSERAIYKKINQALLEFGLLYGLIVWA